MGTREGDEADIESLVKHSTEGNRLHEYFMGFVCILPHIHNMIVLLDFFFPLECYCQTYDIRYILNTPWLTVLTLRRTNVGPSPWRSVTVYEAWWRMISLNEY